MLYLSFLQLEEQYKIKHTTLIINKFTSPIRNSHVAGDILAEKNNLKEEKAPVMVKTTVNITTQYSRLINLYKITNQISLMNARPINIPF